MGKSVVFTWNNEEGTYEVTAGRPGESEEIPEGLEEDMDLRGFLPPKDVDVGDSWEVDLDNFLLLQHPGGIRLVSETSNRTNIEEQKPSNRETRGSIRATFDGVSNHEGVELAMITIVGHLDKTGETEGRGGDGSEHGSIGEKCTVNGKLLWNQESGHLHMLSVSGDVERTVRLWEAPAVEWEVTTRGTAEYAVEVRRD